jgi:hypothetical protein
VQQGADALRDLLHIVLLGEDALGVEPSPERRARTLELARRFGRDRLEAMLGMFFALEARMARAPLASRALLEWTMLRAARLGDLLDTAGLLRSLQSGSPPPGMPAVARPQPTPPDLAGAAGGRKKNPAPTPAAPPPIAPKAPVVPAPAAPAASAATVSLESLLELVRVGRASLGAAVDTLYASGELRADGVSIVLRLPDERTRAILEDPVSGKWLRRLPGSPGPWTFSYLEPANRLDPVGDSLREHFDATEELP